MSGLQTASTESVYPDDLFERLTAVQDAVESHAAVDRYADPNLRWWAIYTKARQEKSLSRDLRSYGVGHFLPLITATSVYRRSRATRQLPLFPGYLFLCGDDDDRVRCLTTNRVSKILPVDEPHQLVRDLAQLQQLILAGAPLRPEDRLAPGDRVRIRSGALAGIEGVVIQRRAEMRLIVSVDFLQQGASVCVDDYLIEAIG